MKSTARHPFLVLCLALCLPPSVYGPAGLQQSRDQDDQAWRQCLSARRTGRPHRRAGGPGRRADGRQSVRAAHGEDCRRHQGDRARHPIRFLINTHVHGDHTGGNANLGAMGVTIVARPQLRARLEKPSPGAGGAPGTPAPAAALPRLTYDAPMTFHMNGEQVQLVPIPARAHRRRHAGQVRQRRRDLDRRFLPLDGLSEHRPRERRDVERHGGGPHQDRRAGRPLDQDRPRPRRCRRQNRGGGTSRHDHRAARQDRADGEERDDGRAGDGGKADRRTTTRKCQVSARPAIASSVSYTRS